MENYKGLSVGQTVTTKVDYFDYKDKIPAGTKFIIKSFPYYPMKKGNFIFGYTENNKCVRLSKNEILTQ